MSRYRLASATYPRNYWNEHGEEILDTANELHNHRWSSRESRHLFANGLRTRSLEATGGSTEQMWVQALAFTFALMNLSALAPQVAYRLGVHESELVGSRIWTEVLGLGALLVLTRSTRMPAVALTPAFYLSVTLHDDWTRGQIGTWIALAILAGLALLIALRGTGRRAIPLSVVGVLGVVAIASVAMGWNPMWLAPLACLIAGLAVAPFEPRMLAIAAVTGFPVVATSIAFWRIDSAVSTIGAKGVVTLTVTGLWLAAVALAIFCNRRLRTRIQI